MRKDNQIFLIVLFITLVAITSCSVFFSLVNLSNNGGSMIEETSYSMPVFDLTSSEIINSSSEITDSSKKEISIIEETSTTIIKEESSIKSPERYPEATKIWNILRSWDWTPETCAGIIGNMMAEVSGGTLDLSHWDLDEPTGFGLIQWLDGRKRALQERYGSIPSIEEQLLFMKDELFGTNNTTKQVSQKNLDIIMNVDKTQTPESIAMCFATYYERCATQHRAKRQRYARKAYEYFIQNSNS